MSPSSTAELADLVLDDATAGSRQRRHVPSQGVSTFPVTRMPGETDSSTPSKITLAPSGHARRRHLEIGELTFDANDPARAGLTKQRRDLDDKDPF